MSKNRFIVVLFALLAVGTLGLTEVASACDQRCLNVGPGFCRQCISTGVYTGGTCENNGPCGCFWTQNTCGLFAATAPAAEANFLVTENATPAQAPTTVELDLVFAGL